MPSAVGVCTFPKSPIIRIPKKGFPSVPFRTVSDLFEVMRQKPVDSFIDSILANFTAFGYPTADQQLLIGLQFFS